MLNRSEEWVPAQVEAIPPQLHTSLTEMSDSTTELSCSTSRAALGRGPGLAPRTMRWIERPFIEPLEALWPKSLAQHRTPEPVIACSRHERVLLLPQPLADQSSSGMPVFSERLVGVGGRAQCCGGSRTCWLDPEGCSRLGSPGRAAQSDLGRASSGVARVKSPE